LLRDLLLSVERMEEIKSETFEFLQKLEKALASNAAMRFAFFTINQ